MSLPGGEDCDEWATAELGAHLMVAFGCRVVSVGDAVAGDRARIDAECRLFEVVS